MLQHLLSYHICCSTCDHICCSTACRPRVSPHPFTLCVECSVSSSHPPHALFECLVAAQKHAGLAAQNATFACTHTHTQANETHTHPHAPHQVLGRGRAEQALAAVQHRWLQLLPHTVCSLLRSCPIYAVCLVCGTNRHLRKR